MKFGHVLQQPWTHAITNLSKSTEDRTPRLSTEIIWRLWGGDDARIASQIVASIPLGVHMGNLCTFCLILMEAQDGP